MPFSVFYFGEFQVFLFLFRVVLTVLEIQSSESSSQITLQSILQLHTWKHLDSACLFPLLPKTQLRHYWNWFFFPSFSFFLFSLSLILPLALMLNRKNSWVFIRMRNKLIIYIEVLYTETVFKSQSDIFFYINLLFIFYTII